MTKIFISITNLLFEIKYYLEKLLEKLEWKIEF